MDLSKRVVERFLTAQQAEQMPMRTLGKTGLTVTGFGMGGQALLEIDDRQKESRDMIKKALDLGVNYFDTAAIYGPSRKYLGQSMGSRRSQIVLASKVYQRGYNEAKKELDESFTLLKTDIIDIVQLHGIKDASDKKCLGKNGSLQVLKEARQAGKIRYIGLTGHYDPDILIEFMNEFDFDTLLVALNPAVPQFMRAIHKAREKNMGVIAMKVMSRGVLPLAFPPDRLLQWTMKRADVSIVGCSNESDVERNVLAAAHYSDQISFEFEMGFDLRKRAAFFAKGYEKQRWPTTYQPNLPELQYE